MKRLLCIWLPNWPVQRLVIAQPELRNAAVILHTRDPRRGQRVVACNRAAFQIGVRRQMSLAEASALADVSDLKNRRTRSNRPANTTTTGFHLQEHNPTADLEQLEQLAAWCERFSSIVSLEDPPSAAPGDLPIHPSSLLLDVTGSAPRLGGEVTLSASVCRDFAERGYVVRIATADTLAAAWGMAHFGNSLPLPAQLQLKPQEVGLGNTAYLAAPHEVVSTLAHLPVAALRLDHDVLELLRQLGIDQVGQLLKLPRSSLSSRFGDSLLRRLDQATGRLDEAITAYRANLPFTVDFSFEHPTNRLEAIDTASQMLLEKLCARLFRRQCGVVRLECQLQLVRQPPVAIQLGLFRPTVDARHLFELISMQLKQQLPQRPVRSRPTRARSFKSQSAGGSRLTRKRYGYRQVAGITLCVLVTAKLSEQQHDLLDDSLRFQPEQLVGLIERLSSRLGRDTVVGTRLLADAQPERGFRFFPLTGERPTPPTSTAIAQQRHRTPPGTRPLRLQATPLRLHSNTAALAKNAETAGTFPATFELDGQLHTVAQHWGPERIETGWWRGQQVRRDYYRVEDTEGQRFWIFRNLVTNEWFLHGVFD